MAKELQLIKYVKKVFEEEMSRDDMFVTKEDLTILLQEGDEDYTPRKAIFGYPVYPLYREVANMLSLWMTQNSCPVLDLPAFSLLDEKSYVEERTATITSITPLLEGLKTLHTLWTDEEITFRIRQVLMLLGFRGILDLLGIRKTVGTKEMLPPPRSALLQSFCAKHHPNSILSVGARALSKHFHRDQTTSWWGNCTGTEQEKNDYALERCNTILDNAVWMNIHWLPHDVFIIEVRQDQGYGVRWSADGASFRGFLEPMLINGHDIGWKH